jgi:sarcosine oxidase gamma subunit
MPISTRKGHVPVADLSLTDVSAAQKWRVFSGYDGIRPGTSQRAGDDLAWSVSPNEWTAVGERPEGAVDLTHVRAMFRLSGIDASVLINRLCALDLSDGMFPDGASARTLFAGVATEIVRDDQEGKPSYLLLPSRSYSTYIVDVIRDAGAEFGLTTSNETP